MGSHELTFRSGADQSAVWHCLLLEDWNDSGLTEEQNNERSTAPPQRMAGWKRVGGHS